MTLSRSTSTTPSRLAKPRTGLPTPGRSSSIPMPGTRSRSASTSNKLPPDEDSDMDFITRSFHDAVKSNNPANHLSSASSASTARPPTSGRSSVSARPMSRQSVLSDAPPRSISRAGAGVVAGTRQFSVGDDVRIESLGFEGRLRYLGAIEGKQGQWAGVELSGGFVGKGKNDGSVGGVQYFSCPPKCGVFVASSKLSAPTVGPNARPPSVASSRNGRNTPGFSNTGRSTPSLTFPSSGRRTPSGSSANGRITPASSTGRSTPATQITPGLPRKRSAVGLPSSISAQTSVSPPHGTPGSRASRYVSMTATDLNRTGSPHVGSPFATPRPTPPSAHISSSINVNSPASPSKGRTSLGTPRARVPSSVSMPPPASPDLSISQGSLFSPPRASISSGQQSVPGSPSPARGPRPGSSMSDLFPDRERERDREVELMLQRRLDALIKDHALATERADELASRLRTAERSLNERDMKLGELENQTSTHAEELKELRARVEEAKAQNEELQKQKDILQQELDRAPAKNESLLAERVELDDVKDRRITELEAAQQAFEAQRKELMDQIDELREAGQETIALYEERISAADAHTIELEDRIQHLEGRTRPQSSADVFSLGVSSAAPSAASSVRSASPNEADANIAALMKRINALEEALEDARLEELESEGRVKRAREKEDQARAELTAQRAEISRMQDAEAAAAKRVAEMEEALKESTRALEDQRSEVEGLRAEIANLSELGINKGESTQSSAKDQTTIAELQAKIQDFEVIFTDLESEKQELESTISAQASALEKEQQISSELQQTLDDRTTELENLRKKLHGDDSDSGPLPESNQDVDAIKQELSTTREEAKGLKHIVQDLQNENSTMQQRLKLLESENRILISESDQLRQDLKTYESSLDRSITHEERSLSRASSMTFINDNEVETLRKRLAEMETKNARTVHDLNKEISELEGLIESKIYREDELEQEIEQLRSQVSRLNRTPPKSKITAAAAVSPEAARTSLDAAIPDVRLRKSSESSNSSGEIGGSTNPSSSTEPVCEICERPGHDIFNCDLLRDGPTTVPDAKNHYMSSSVTSDPSELFCEDCESHGHVAAECPHSLDVF